MPRLGEVAFRDKRKKPITVKNTKLKDKGISFNPVSNPTFKKGGFVARGCGKVMNNRRKVTKVY
jgi:hypothetical protein